MWIISLDSTKHNRYNSVLTLANQLLLLSLHMNTSEDSSGSGSNRIRRRTSFAWLAALPLLVTGCDPPPEIQNDLLVKLKCKIEEYRKALNACMKTPNEDTAAALDRTSGSANSEYALAQRSLNHDQRQEIGGQLWDLHERAEEAIQGIEVQTQYTQLYIQKISRRKATLLLQTKNDHQAGAIKYLEDGMFEARSETRSIRSNEDSL